MSDNALATTTEKQIQTVDYKQKAVEYLRATGTNLSDNQMNMFVEIATAFGLNPFKREIYAVKYKDNFNIITGYEVYIKRAERSGLLAGWRCEYDAQEKIATIFIKRKDWENEFVHTVYDDEYNSHNSIWQSKPITMLKKVAIAQGFRMCFPDELGGMPYTDDEMETVPQERNVTGTADDVYYKVSDLEPQAEPSGAELAIEAIMNEHGDKVDNKARKILNDLMGEKKFAQALDRLKKYLKKKGVRV